MRGLDSTGTVIILAKGELWELSELYTMMQGKATRLQSKFRLTYSMILNLLRVEQLRVEDMMKRSFAEMDTQKKQAGYAERGKVLKAKLETMSDISSPNFGDASQLYSLISEFATIRENIWTMLLSLPIPGKALSPGRVVIIHQEASVNILGIILHVDMKAKQRTFQVLINRSAESQDVDNEEVDARKNLFLSLVDQKIQSTDVMSSHHSVVSLTDVNILQITNKVFKIEPDKIINDIKKREIPRFKFDPPSQSVSTALQQLLRVTDQVIMMLQIL